jgi:hypothetical protein
MDNRENMTGWINEWIGKSHLPNEFGVSTDTVEQLIWAMAMDYELYDEFKAAVESERESLINEREAIDEEEWTDPKSDPMYKIN